MRGLPLNVNDLVLLAWAPRLWPSDFKHGFRIQDSNPQSRLEFVKAVDTALALIEENDALRFGRLSIEVRTIIHMPCMNAGRYSRPFRVCLVDLRHFPFAEDPELAIRLLAGLLVHESTHGYLYRKKVLQTRRRDLHRVESICWMEEVRFHRKLGFDYSSFKPSTEWLKDPPLRERFKFAAGAFKRELNNGAERKSD